MRKPVLKSAPTEMCSTGLSVFCVVVIALLLQLATQDAFVRNVLANRVCGPHNKDPADWSVSQSLVLAVPRSTSDGARDPREESSTLTASGPYDDEFNGPTLNDRWSWHNEDATRWSLTASPGNLRIVATFGDIRSSCANAKNLLLQEAPPGDFEIQTKVSINPTVNYQQAGLLVFLDVTHHIKLGPSWNGPECGGQNIYFRLTDGQPSNSWPFVPADLSRPVFLKIARSDATYTGYYSFDGEDFVELGSITPGYTTNPLIGLHAMNSCYGSPPDIPADFDYFRLIETGAPIISGHITDAAGAWISGVAVSAGSGGSATTDALGYYSITLSYGPNIYTVTPTKSGYTFSPPQRIVSLLTDVTGQDFLGVAGGNPPPRFLDLPFQYGDTEQAFVQALRDTYDNGRVDSWFDHDYPNGGKNQRLVLYDGRLLTKNPYLPKLGCYEGRCYDGHNGIDFCYQDPEPLVSGDQPLPIHPAAAGVAVDIANDCSDTCLYAACEACGDYGNYVLIYHGLDDGSGYFTLYAHLNHVEVAKNASVNRETWLGNMGSTGNSSGTHLHFGVYRDNDGQGEWSASLDKPVDPFGWDPSGSEGFYPDPWVKDYSGTTSYYLWIYTLANQESVSGGQGGTLLGSTGDFEGTLGPGAFSGHATFELSPALVAEPFAGLYSSGHSFWLRLREWLSGGSSLQFATALEATDGFTLTQPMTLTVHYTDTDVLHLDLSQLLLYHWDSEAGSWQPLTTIVDQANHAAEAQTQELGDFDLQGPLLCPADSLEPDDSFDNAGPIIPDSGPVSRLFDVAEDEDWFQLDAEAGRKFLLQTSNLAAEVDTALEVFDTDGLTLLASDDNSGGRAASKLEWTAPLTGTYFVRVSQAAGSAYGCTASYDLDFQSLALGDVNGDEVVDSTDALIILSADAGLATVQFCPMNSGDVNADGLVDSTDALIVLSYDAGLTVPFAVGQLGYPLTVTQPPGCSL